MANTGLYAPYKKADVDILDPGLLKAWISLLSDFDTLNEPVLSVSPTLGEAYTIGTTHAWTSGKEAVPIFIDADSLEAPGESNGAPRSQRLVHRPKIFIMGDGPNILEMVNNWLNEELIIFVQDQCNPKKYIQYGCDCYPVVVEKQAFATGTLLGSNAKGYEMTLRALCKYFYTGDIDERTA